MGRWDKVTAEEREAQQAETRTIIDAKVRDLLSTGFKRVCVLDSGTGADCPACQALAAAESWAIDELPDIPPNDCSCIPWCRCVVVATE